MINALRNNFYTILLALVFVGLAQPLAPMARGWWNATAPVVNMKGVLVEKTPDYVLIHITGEKLRACKFVNISAFTEADGNLIDSFITRMGYTKIDGATKPIGKHDLGLWRVYPINGSKKALVYVQHDCAGEVVMTKIAEVSI